MVQDYNTLYNFPIVHFYVCFMFAPVILSSELAGMHIVIDDILHSLEVFGVQN